MTGLTPAEPRSEADAALDRVIAAEPIVLPPPVSDLVDPDAHRRTSRRRGW
jgi:hypothetical protein